jgi:hypothetical protein
LFLCGNSNLSFFWEGNLPFFIANPKLSPDNSDMIM